MCSSSKVSDLALNKHNMWRPQAQSLLTQWGQELELFTTQRVPFILPYNRGKSTHEKLLTIIAYSCSRDKRQSESWGPNWGSRWTPHTSEQYRSEGFKEAMLGHPFFPLEKMTGSFSILETAQAVRRQAGTFFVFRSKNGQKSFKNGRISA